MGSLVISKSSFSTWLKNTVSEQKYSFILKHSVLQLFWQPLKLAISNVSLSCAKSITGSVFVVSETKSKELWKRDVSTQISNTVLEAWREFKNSVFNKFLIIASRPTDFLQLSTGFLLLSDLTKLNVIFYLWSLKKAGCAASAQVFHFRFLITQLSGMLWKQQPELFYKKSWSTDFSSMFFHFLNFVFLIHFRNLCTL